MVLGSTGVSFRLLTGWRRLVSSVGSGRACGSGRHGAPGGTALETGPHHSSWVAHRRAWSLRKRCLCRSGRSPASVGGREVEAFARSECVCVCVCPLCVPHIPWACSSVHPSFRASRSDAVPPYTRYSQFRPVDLPESQDHCVRGSFGGCAGKVPSTSTRTSAGKSTEEANHMMTPTSTCVAHQKYVPYVSYLSGTPQQVPTRCKWRPLFTCLVRRLFVDDRQVGGCMVYSGSPRKGHVWVHGGGVRKKKSCSPDNWTVQGFSAHFQGFSAGQPGS